MEKSFNSKPVTDALVAPETDTRRWGRTCDLETYEIRTNTTQAMGKKKTFS